ncbi:hypothetical protein QAD02_005838 [Eretmocerus hayati]|uniref:Uncharacterized protein n=1 Tax=Eretmocerus hayati TaxID=131215 RepID=A0ACC2NVD9_9HYME|nr:hypothetical protein QAD02_005838 [Eretmocerus hayati]
MMSHHFNRCTHNIGKEKSRPGQASKLVPTYKPYKRFAPKAVLLEEDEPSEPTLDFQRHTSEWANTNGAVVVDFATISSKKRLERRPERLTSWKQSGGPRRRSSTPPNTELR